jgi:hypothetical protein
LSLDKFSTTKENQMNSLTSSRFLLSRNPHYRVFWSADDGAHNPGGDNAAPPAVTPPATNPNPQPQNNSGKSVADQVQEAIANLLGKKNNDPMAAMDTLIRENHALRTRAEAAEHSQLSKADRELLANFKALGLSLDDVKRIVGEHKSWGEERAKNAKVESLKKAAQAAGINADLLASLEGALDPEYSVVGEGESAKAMVKITNGDTKTDKALDEWAKEKWPALQETLKATPAGNQQGNQNNQQQRTVTRYGQGAGVGGAGGGQTKDRVQERLDARREANKDKKNPLMQ